MIHPRIVLILAIKALGVLALIVGALDCFEPVVKVGSAFARSSEPFWRWPWSWLFGQIPPVEITWLLVGLSLLLFSRGLARIIMPATRRICGRCGMDWPTGTESECPVCEATLDESVVTPNAPFRAHSVFRQTIRVLGLFVMWGAFSQVSSLVIQQLTYRYTMPGASKQVDWAVIQYFLTVGTIWLGAGVMMVFQANRIARILRGRRMLAKGL